MDVEGALFVEGTARLAFVAGFALRCQVQAVDCLGKDAGTRGFPDAAGTAEEIGMRQFLREDCILERGGQRFLPDNGVKRCRTIFSG